MKQGEVWLINLEPTIGAEIRKTRPAIIVNDNALGKLPLKVIVPITDWKERYSIAPWMVKITPDPINNLTKESAADCFQVRSVSEERLIKRLGIARTEVMEKIRRALSIVLTHRINFLIQGFYPYASCYIYFLSVNFPLKRILAVQVCDATGVK